MGTPRLNPYLVGILIFFLALNVASILWAAATQADFPGIKAP
ncbi:MAG: hypothetical protein ACE5KW_00670 [Dehalococcoidia bacterium]